MLKIMTLTYQPVLQEELRKSGDLESRRKILVKTYVEWIFAHRKQKSRYSMPRIYRYLSYLAHEMSKRSESMFAVELIQPTWLSTKSQKILYAFGSRVLAGLSAGSLFGGLVGLLLGAQVFVIDPFIQIAIVAGLPENNPLEIMLPLIVLLGLPSIIILTVITSFGIGIVGTGIGFLNGLFNFKRISSENIAIIVGLEWSWEALRDTVSKKFRIFLIRQIVPGALNDFAIPYYWLVIEFADALSVGLRPVVLSNAIALTRKLRQSITHVILGMTIGMIYGLVFTSIIAILSAAQTFLQLNVGSSQTMNSGWEILSLWGAMSAIFGPIFAIISGLRSGWLAYIQNFVIRRILVMGDNIPSNVVDFLDYAVELGFLQKVGVAYIFSHPLFQEFFVTQTEKENSARVNSI